MKNIHIIPTDKPSRLKQNKITKKLSLVNKGIDLTAYTPVNIYITNDEEIKEGDWFYDLDTKYVKVKQSWEKSHLGFNGKKIILTNDIDLIADGIQAIDDDFLEWFVNNPSCEEVEVLKIMSIKKYKIIIPKKEKVFDGFLDPEYGSPKWKFNYKTIAPKEEPKQETFNTKRGLKEIQLKDPNTCEFYKEIGCIKDICDCYTLVPKQETLEEAAENYVKEKGEYAADENKESFINGAKWQQERYSKMGIIDITCDTIDYEMEKYAIEQFKNK